MCGHSPEEHMQAFFLVQYWAVIFIIPPSEFHRLLSLATNTITRTFTTVADQQQTVQFPVYQGERVNCEDNTSLGEFTLAPIPPMKAGEAVLECIFEVDVNGILKVTATEKTSGRSSNITISNTVGKLSSTEIDAMISGQYSNTCLI